MTKELANQILNLWRSGARHYQQSIIDQCLVITGDITGSLNHSHIVDEDA
jgi:hypothetical protein